MGVALGGRDVVVVCVLMAEAAGVDAAVGRIFGLPTLRLPLVPENDPKSLLEELEEDDADLCAWNESKDAQNEQQLFGE